MKITTGIAAFGMPSPAPQFTTLQGTGLPVAAWTPPIAPSTVADQRPRNAKLGRPPREHRC